MIVSYNIKDNSILVWQEILDEGWSTKEFSNEFMSSSFSIVSGKLVKTDTLPEETFSKKGLVSSMYDSSKELSSFTIPAWTTFSNEEIGDIITHRVFGWNPHAERATTNKVLKILAGLVLGFAATGTMPQMTEEQWAKITAALWKGAEVDAVRNFFALDSL